MSQALQVPGRHAPLLLREPVVGGAEGVAQQVVTKLGEAIAGRISAGVATSDG
jgi:hypothetical protein